jgi:phosphoglycolate phosphatase-like HAD superfamily hydrolase
VNYWTTKALNSLAPDAVWSMDAEDYDTLIWYNENELPPPTEEEVQAEVERLQAEYEYNQYQRNRATAYPSIQEQLDTLYHQGYDGWKASIDEVKNKYPKPGEDL